MSTNIIDSKVQQKLSSFILNALQNKEAPTTGALVKVAQEIKKAHSTALPELSLIAQESSLFNNSYNVAPSASEWRAITEAASGDIESIYATYQDIITDRIYATRRLVDEIRSINERIPTLIARVNRVLLLSDYSEGSLSTVFDDFSTTQKINLDGTTADVNTADKTVSLKRLETPLAINGNNMDLSLLSEEDFNASIVEVTAWPSPGTRDSSLKDMVKEDNRPWLFTAGARSQGATVTVRVDIDLLKSIKGRGATNRVTIDPVCSEAPVSITVQTSKDKIVWSNLSSTEQTRRVTTATTFNVPITELRYIRIYMSKSVHDRISQEGSFLYDYGIRGVYIRNLSYVPESTFISGILSPETDVRIRRAAISTICEQVPPQTQIDYSIAFVKDDNTVTDFYPVVPIDGDGDGPRIVEIGTGEPVLQTTTTLDGETFLGSTMADLKVLNYPSFTQGIILRNIGSNKHQYTYLDEEAVERDAGWKYNYTTKRYETFVFTKASSTKKINLGPTKMRINGIEVTGEVTLPVGVSKVEVYETNYLSLGGLAEVYSFNENTKTFSGKRAYYPLSLDPSEEPLEEQNYQIVDPLYPYNHKAIIEGVSFAGNYSGPARALTQYAGVETFGAYFMSEGNYSLLTSTKDPSLYYKADHLKDIRTVKVVVAEVTIDGVHKERFAILESNDESAKGIIFKAVLKGTQKTSPSIDGYEIKLSE